MHNTSSCVQVRGSGIQEAQYEAATSVFGDFKGLLLVIYPLSPHIFNKKYNSCVTIGSVHVER
jgi:hypothetical protein